MTDIAPEQTEPAADAAPQMPFEHFYPARPDNPHESPLSVNFSVDRGPQVTVRGRTPSEWKDLLEEVRDSGVFAIIGEAYAALKAQGAVGAGLGPTTVMNGAPAPVQAAPAAPPQQFAPPAGPNFNPQLPPPGQPGQAPAPWQNAGAPQQQPQQWGGQQNGGGQGGAQAAPQGWYKLNVPFPSGKDQLHALAMQYGIPKGNPSKGGKYNFWSAPAKAWYCAPEVAQAFAQFSPVPA